MIWSNQWNIIQGAWPKPNAWLKDLREQIERESKLIKEAAERIARDERSQDD